MEINRLLSNAFNSIKEKDRLRKEINRLLNNAFNSINKNLREKIGLEKKLIGY